MKTLITLALLSLASSAHAADSFTCKSSQSGSAEVTVQKSKLTIRADGEAAELFGKDVTAKRDETYKPRAQHEGSLRYEASNSCGGYDVIIDKAMASGKAGRLTMQQDCDSDGTGPSYTVFDCR